MTFEEFYADAVGRGMNAEHRPAMLTAWDAALCAAQMECFEQGRIKPADTIARVLSDLHSWVKPTTEKLS